MPDMITLTDVYFGYKGGDGDVLRGVNLNVEPGERVGLLGPSGSGKSTLLMLLNGIIRPTAGTVDVAAGSRVWIHQDPRTFPRRSVLDNVAIGAMHRASTWKAARAEAAMWLERLGIGEISAQAAVTASGGQRQRVCLARALAGGYQLMLLDEPTAQLDHETAMAAMTTFLDACDRDRTLVIATHDRSIVTLLDRAIHLEDGRVGSATRT